MMGHNISFFGKIWKIIPKLSLLTPSYLEHCLLSFTCSTNSPFSYTESAMKLRGLEVVVAQFSYTDFKLNDFC